MFLLNRLKPKSILIDEKTMQIMNFLKYQGLKNSNVLVYKEETSIDFKF